MNWKLLLFLLCFATEWVIATQPTQLRSHHFTEADGLSSNLVYGFAQDHNGLMWIGTSNGLNRFDGSTFKVFRKDFADINSVRDNMIIRIAVDSKTIFGSVMQQVASVVTIRLHDNSRTTFPTPLSPTLFHTEVLMECALIQRIEYGWE